MFRKKFFGIAAIGAGIAATAGITAASCIMEGSGRDSTLSEAGIFVMDTYCTISVDGSSAAAVSDLLYELDSRFDSFDENSEISLLGSGYAVDRSTSTAKLIEKTLLLQEEYKGGVDITSGALTKLWRITSDDPHVPDEQELSSVLQTIGKDHVHISREDITLDTGTQLDLGAVAKGYALDCTKELLEEAGASYGIVSMTSSMLLFGEKSDGSPFEIAVRSPDGGDVLGKVKTESCFLSTSGGYERFFTGDDGKTYSHILDPINGYPAETDLTTVTVFCDSGLLSDYLSTLIYMGGSAQIEKHLHAEEYKLVAADTEGNLYISDGLEFKAE